MLPPPRVGARSDGRVDPGYTAREVIERLYNVSSLTGAVDIGVVEYIGGEGFSQADLRAYQTANGLPAKNVSADHIIGTNSHAGVEGELDIQMIANLGDANLWFIFINGWIYDFASLYYKQPELFNDITVGYSECTEAECCSADWGWDVASGLGTPNVGRIVEELRKYV